LQINEKDIEEFFTEQSHFFILGNSKVYKERILIMSKILVGDIFAVIATFVALSIPLTIIGLLIYIAKLLKKIEQK